MSPSLDQVPGILALMQVLLLCSRKIFSLQEKLEDNIGYHMAMDLSPEDLWFAVIEWK